MTLSSNLRAILFAAAGLGLAAALSVPASANIVNPTCPTNTTIPGSYQPNSGGGACKCPAGTYPEFLQPNSFQCMSLGHMTVTQRQHYLATQKLHNQTVQRANTCGGRGQKACPAKTDDKHPKSK